LPLANGGYGAHNPVSTAAEPGGLDHTLSAPVVAWLPRSPLAMSAHVLDPISNLPIGPEVPVRAAARPEGIRLAGRFVRLEPLDPQVHGPSLWRETHGSGAAALWQYLFDKPFADERSFQDFLTLKAASADPLFYAIVDQASGRAVGFQ